MPARSITARIPGIRTPVRGLVAMAGLAVLTACGPVSVSNVASGVDRSDGPVQVALLVPGGSSDEGRQVLAESLENAARLAVSDLNGVDIDLRVYDTAGDPEQAEEVAMEAADAGASIILGPVYGDEARAVGAAVASEGLNVLSFSNNTEIAGDNVFVLGQTFGNTAERLLAYAADEGKDQVMIVGERTSEGEAAQAAIETAAARAGASIVATEIYSFSQQGIVDALPDIASTARSSEADTLFFTANTAGALPILAQLLPDNRISQPDFQFMGLTRWDIPPETLELRGLQDGWFATPDPSMAERFEERYEETYDDSPHPIAGLAYDGIAAIGALLATDESDALSRAALTQGSGFVGVNGVFRFRPDGTNERGLAVATIQDNEVVILDPAPRSFAGPGS
ncbi:MAG: ABC-type branched-chain amino acid transporter periplasmic component [Rhodobacteraceae bacterium HLUCCA12]|nr:MAG: ABC-type branched-chain amino acid transporter periplasmic component [Rhodobacteraceae bacterium HLUCCA12]